MQPLQVTQRENLVPEFAELVGNDVVKVGVTPSNTIVLFVTNMSAATARDLAERVEAEWTARHVVVVPDSPTGGSAIGSTMSRATHVADL